MKELQALLDKVNKELATQGMLKLVVLDPVKILPSRKNARYMQAETMLQLTENVRKDGRLESTPLVYWDTELDRYRLISGNHRTDSAKAAGLNAILCLVAEPTDEDEIVSKQLAHNALVGVDDKEILRQLFQSIKDIGQKMATGLSDAEVKISYSSLSFRAGNYKEFTVMFLPEDVVEYDEQMTKLAEEFLTKPQTEVRLTSMAYFEHWSKTIMKVKRVENIKSNGVAVMRMLELALERLEQMQKEEEDGVHEAEA